MEAQQGLVVCHTVKETQYWLPLNELRVIFSGHRVVMGCYSPGNLEANLVQVNLIRGVKIVLNLV
jgi:hypothetical protein